MKVRSSEPTAGVGGDPVDLDSYAHSQPCGLITNS